MQCTMKREAAKSPRGNRALKWIRQRQYFTWQLTELHRVTEQRETVSRSFFHQSSRNHGIPARSERDVNWECAVVVFMRFPTNVITRQVFCILILSKRKHLNLMGLYLEQAYRVARTTVQTSDVTELYMEFLQQRFKGPSVGVGYPHI